MILDDFHPPGSQAVSDVVGGSSDPFPGRGSWDLGRIEATRSAASVAPRP